MADRAFDTYLSASLRKRNPRKGSRAEEKRIALDQGAGRVGVCLPRLVGHADDGTRTRAGGSSGRCTRTPRCSPSWTRLIARVYQVDPLVCSRCGKKMVLLAFVTDTFAVRRILDHLGLSPPEPRPPPLHEVRRVPVDEDCRELSTL